MKLAVNDGRFRTRFAPSPSGHLHLGHVYAALVARRLADEKDGECLIRIEDIDQERCREVFVDAIFEDMDWLGIRFDGEVMVQSRRMGCYKTALDSLKEMGVLYPCFCTRKGIAKELEEMGRAPQGEFLDPYPGRCRRLGDEERRLLIDSGAPHSWRLDCQRAAEMTGALTWRDLNFGTMECRPELIGDVILGRKDCLVSYHIAVVVDDAEQGISVVSRGEDLLQATHIHRVLQALLRLDVPLWSHHGLVRDEYGTRLAKRDKSLSIRQMRKEGATPQQVMGMLEFMK